MTTRPSETVAFGQSCPGLDFGFKRFEDQRLCPQTLGFALSKESVGRDIDIRQA